MANIYISIVGTQIAAVFNPISVLEKENIAIDKVVLMATDKSEKYAKVIKTLLAAHSKIKAEKVDIENISDLDRTDNQQRPAAHEVLQKYSDEKHDLIIFNMAGGMNFQITLCAMQMVKADHWQKTAGSSFICSCRFSYAFWFYKIYSTG